MPQNATTQKKPHVRRFFNRLIKANYQLEADSPIRLVFDSDEKIPYLDQLSTDQYKLHCIINLLVAELEKLGRNVTYSRIKDDYINKDSRKKALVYQVLNLDEETSLLWDFFFVLDTQQFKLYCFRQLAELSQESDRLLKVANYLHENLFKDSEEIHTILKKNQIDVPYNQVIHILSEIIQ